MKAENIKQILIQNNNKNCNRMSIMRKYHWYPFGKNSTVVCYSEHAQAKGDVLSCDLLGSFWLVRRKKLRFHPRQLYPAAKQGEVQRVLLMLSMYLCARVCISHICWRSASELIFSLSLSVSRGHRPVVSVGLSEQTQRSSRCRSEGSAGGVLPARTGELYSHNPY